MHRPPRSGRSLTIGFAIVATILAPRPGVASDPPDSPPAPKVRVEDEVSQGIKPLPLVGIPDNPPPHEGALIDLPVVVEPPDVIVVEVLMALPGRPITGERLVRPDGTISLGFYGDVHVRGLTPQQIKVKIVDHLRRYLSDQVLGLVRFQVNEAEIAPAPEPGKQVPGSMPVAPDRRPFEKPDVVPPGVAPPAEGGKAVEPEPAKPALAKTSRATRRAGRRLRRASQVTQDVKPADSVEQKPKDSVMPVPADKAEGEEMVEGQFIAVDPQDTDRIFVDIVEHNTKIYYVQGDVGTPGRLPFTGKETILDALIYAGGLVPTAEPTDIHLYRPARGDQPLKIYRIDYQAILQGDKVANLQVFPDDRLVVGRNPIVKKTMDIDRAGAAINSIFNSALSYSFTTRSLGVGPNGTTSLSQTERDEALKRWVEFFWKFTSNEGISLLDEKALRDSLLKKLEPTPDSKEAKPPSQ